MMEFGSSLFKPVTSFLLLCFEHAVKGLVWFVAMLLGALMAACSGKPSTLRIASTLTSVTALATATGAISYPR